MISRANTNSATASSATFNHIANFLRRSTRCVSQTRAAASQPLLVKPGRNFNISARRRRRKKRPLGNIQRSPGLKILLSKMPRPPRFCETCIASQGRRIKNAVPSKKQRSCCREDTKLRSIRPARASAFGVFPIFQVFVFVMSALPPWSGSCRQFVCRLNSEIKQQSQRPVRKPPFDQNRPYGALYVGFAAFELIVLVAAVSRSVSLIT